MSQHDYVIDNQTFPATRTDINNALAAIVTTNAGATAPSTTYAYQLWYDTTNDILKMRNSDNDAWIDLFDVNQTTDAASAKLDGDVTISGDLTVDTNTLHVDSASNLVGIGTSPSGAKLDIFTGSTTQDGLKINRFGSGTYYSTLRQDSHGLAVRVGDGSTIAERVAITPNGLTFNGDTAAANALDDYEEGSFLSTITYSTTITNTSPSSTLVVTAYYTKIGNLCKVDWPTITQSGVFASNAIISQATVPFTSASDARTACGSFRGYNMRGRFGSSILNQGQLSISVGGSTTTAFVLFDTHTLGGAGYVSFEASSSYLNMSLVYRTA